MFWAAVVAPLILRMLPVTQNPRIQRFAAVGTAFAAIVLLSVLALKELWGRPRFRDLSEAQTGFSMWLVPQGPNGNHSFPSGHTAFAWMMLPLITLVPQQRRGTRRLVTVAVVGWGITCALSRVYIGAHFASDVLFSTYLSAVVFITLTGRGTGMTDA